MPLISVTRLRVRALRYLPFFFIAAARSSRLARRAEANLGVRLMTREALRRHARGSFGNPGRRGRR
jgi:hypothetical protein